MAAQADVVRDRQIQAHVQGQPQAQSGDGKSSSRTVTDTIIGESRLSKQPEALCAAFDAARH